MAHAFFRTDGTNHLLREQENMLCQHLLALKWEISVDRLQCTYIWILFYQGVCNINKLHIILFLLCILISLKEEFIGYLSKWSLIPVFFFKLFVLFIHIHIYQFKHSATHFHKKIYPLYAYFFLLIFSLKAVQESCSYQDVKTQMFHIVTLQKVPNTIDFNDPL